MNSLLCAQRPSEGSNAPAEGRFPQIFSGIFAGFLSRKVNALPLFAALGYSDKP
jgi:hypothetical protein